MNIKGKVYRIFNTQKVSDTFKKREFVVDYRENPQYPEFLKFELIQEKCELLDSLNEGQEVDVYFNLRGREWTNPKGEKVYFNSLQAWKIDHIEENGNQEAYAPPSDDTLTSFSDDDVLPF
jgi:hypothetical protein